jgi:hypothetical protein
MKATIIRHHARHYTVVDRDQTPVKRLFETLHGFGDLRDRNLQAECENWLAENGYFPTANKMEWLKGKEVIVRWQAVYETKIVVPHDADLDSQSVKDEAANIDLTVNGSEYQTDTWEVESIKPA